MLEREYRREMDAVTLTAEQKERLTDVMTGAASAPRTGRAGRTVLAAAAACALLAVSGYSFLGLGVLPPGAEWGMMMNDGRSYMSHPQMMAWPGLCLLAVIVCVNGAGDRLRDWIEDKRT